MILIYMPLDDDFRCKGCKALGKQPPSTKADARNEGGNDGDEDGDDSDSDDSDEKRVRHTYLHALVRCNPKANDQADTSTTEVDDRVSVNALHEKVADLDGKVGELSNKVKGLEDCLGRVEETLKQVLLRLEHQVQTPAAA